VKKAINMQLQEQNDVPLQTLLSTAIQLLGLRDFEFNETEWGEVSSICANILKHVCRCDNTYGTSLATKELRHFVVKIVCAFLMRVDLENEDALNEVVASIPPIRHSPKENGTASHSCLVTTNGEPSETSTENLLEFVVDLEELISNIKVHDIPPNSEVMARLRKVLAELEGVCQ
jgi:hypothetical protein